MVVTQQAEAILGAVPCSIEAERALLGSILIDPTCFIEIAGIIKGAQDFYILRHQVIWLAIERIKERKDEIDHIILADDLRSTGDLENIGGRSYLVEVMNETGIGMYAAIYAGLINRTAIRRRMLVAADEMKRLALDETLALEDVRAQADDKWLSVTSETTRRNGAWMSEVISELYDEVNRRILNQRRLPGVSTGLRDLDDIMLGFEPSTLTIVAGRPGMGKSALMDNFALYVAGELGLTVFYATSERSQKQVGERMAVIKTNIAMFKFKTGKMKPEELEHWTNISGEIADLPIYFEDAPMPTPREIFAQAKWAVERHSAKLILFDGMYRSKTGNAKIDGDNHKKYGEIALQLKTISRELDVPVVATHQLNRAVEQRQDKRPVMSDLRESGRIEEEADKILFLYRDEVYNEATEFPSQCDLLLVKHRDGATGVVSAYFEKSKFQFMNASLHRVDLSDLE